MEDMITHLKVRFRLILLGVILMFYVGIVLCLGGCVFPVTGFVNAIGTRYESGPIVESVRFDAAGQQLEISYRVVLDGLFAGERPTLQRRLTVPYDKLDIFLAGDQDDLDGKFFEKISQFGDRHWDENRYAYGFGGRYACETAIEPVDAMDRTSVGEAQSDLPGYLKRDDAGPQYDTTKTLGEADAEYVRRGNWRELYAGVVIPRGGKAYAIYLPSRDANHWWAIPVRCPFYPVAVIVDVFISTPAAFVYLTVMRPI